MFTLGTACGPEKDDTDKKEPIAGRAATPSTSSQFDDYWSYQGSKVSSANPADARENLLGTAQFFDDSTINVGKSSGTPFLIVDKYYTSPDEPVGMAVSHPEGGSGLGEELIMTTRVDKPGQDKLFGQFKSALGANAVPFDGTLPQGVEKAIWIHDRNGQPTGMVYHSKGVTASMNFSRPQSHAFLQAQLDKVGPYMELLYNAGYNNTPAS